MIIGYEQLSNERIINLAIDFVKMNQKLPLELELLVSKLGLLEVLYPKGDVDED